MPLSSETNIRHTSARSAIRRQVKEARRASLNRTTRVPYGCVLRQNVETVKGLPVPVGPVFVALRKKPGKVYPMQGKAEMARRVGGAA